ncbi:MAG: type II toxin-antitoxin system PemK/MazF family toxin [candidate division KSB1 bacterium]|nr:type II toxin-antitoxin system PemK/MazF family toxin [candidate division KSB1 bacterium]MDZ7366394.1 type II toxin-antitoxin system PemK/MazF family toxin [candidate division KSB1 bacterium]MDZ7404049.1 type II toxin-antitoxin system PemK/MazF family toxin [candidate division KSB1 bacterium]
MSSIMLTRGDIVVAAFPYTDLAGQKRRPPLVLNDNTEHGDVILAFISTQIPSQLSPSSVLLTNTAPDFQQTGLKTDSVIQLATIERRLITRRLGKLSPGKLFAVDKALLVALQISLSQP